MNRRAWVSVVTAAIVAAGTWSGTFAQDAAEPPADPAAFNGEKLPRSAADELDGPPFVTCKAWAIVDGRTGDWVAGEKEKVRLPIASTTKIMTAYLVLSLAQDRPAVLDEELTFSQRADDTVGSTAEIRAGEKLPVREVLYGLLLPSGNDAATALAEHFGTRLAPPAEGQAGAAADAGTQFVAAMNQAAAQLEMKESEYANPHGLTDKKHLSTARDQLRLAHAAMKLPLFAEYVGTRQRACRVTNGDGKQRTVVWKNTNRLLSIDGYDGVKTGTTDAAGCCLVSRGTRNGASLLVCVLGSTSTEARYTDTRNLFRWAWQRRGNGS